MEITRKCVVCGAELGPLEGHPETVEMPATASFPMPSGGVNLYCDKCWKEREKGYEEMSGKSFSKEELHKKVLEKVKTALERDDIKIIISKEGEGYNIRYEKYKNSK